MAERYTDKIKTFCEESGIEIPAGFYRHPASRYVAIELQTSSQKLVAKTWSKQEDVVYYLTRLAQGKKFRVLDFKEREELSYNGKDSLERGNQF